MTIDELIVQTLENDDELILLGLTPGSVYQPDTAMNPPVRPFIVLRWGSTQRQVGRMKERPLNLWVYDQPGDLSRSRKIVQRCADILSVMDPVRLDDGGFLHSFTEGAQSQDSYDDGFKSTVIAKELMAVLE